jgi:hypothetical protein
MKKIILLYIAALGMAILLPQVALAEDRDLSKELANPIADLINVVIEADYDHDIGDDNGSQWITNLEPTIPFSISENWNVISRTSLPIITQDDISSDGAEESGIGDIFQHLFISPKKPITSHGLIWGAGPVLLLNTASNDALGANKWGAGPGAAALIQEGPWTIGILTSHIWSFAGNNSSSGVSVTSTEPYIAYVTQSETTFTLNTESTYDWKAKSWSVPIIFKVEQLLKVGRQIIQVGGGLRYWAASPDSGPEGLGARLSIVFVFPAK